LTYSKETTKFGANVITVKTTVPSTPKVGNVNPVNDGDGLQTVASPQFKGWGCGGRGAKLIKGPLPISSFHSFHFSLKKPFWWL